MDEEEYAFSLLKALKLTFEEDSQYGIVIKRLD